MGSSNGTLATQVSTEEPLQQQTVEVNLHIGVFFDGTNNNKVQSMLALQNRRKKFYNKHKKELESSDKHICSAEEMMSISRMEMKNITNVTDADLDSIYGTSQTFNFDFEKGIVNDNSTEYKIASTADQYQNIEDYTRLNKNEKFKKGDNKIVEFGKFLFKNTIEEISFQKKHLLNVHPFFTKLSPSQGSNYTNPAILSFLYNTSDTISSNTDGNTQDFYYSVYIEGSGADKTMTTVGHVTKIKPSIIGLGFGVGKNGITEKCKYAAQRIKEIYYSYKDKNDVAKINLYFDIYGFSRGATSARLFTYIIDPKNENAVDPGNKDSNDTENKEDQEKETKKKSDDALYTLCTGKEERFLGKDTPKLGEKKIITLGLFDTVGSVGILRDPINVILENNLLKMSEKDEFKSPQTTIFHDTNVDDFKLYSTDLAEHVLHLCALDENRKNFALVDIKSSIGKNGIEIFLPGCHTDIGGGGKLGLDDLKIINCDEIATRGKILYNLEVRIKGIIEATNGFKDMNKDLLGIGGSISGGAAAPAALPGALWASYNLSKAFIIHLNSAVEGCFATFTGYKNIEEYQAKHKKVTDDKKPKKPSDEHATGFDVLAEAADLTIKIKNIKKNNVINNSVKSSQEKLDKLKTSFTEKDLPQIYKNGRDIKQISESLYNQAETLFKLVKSLISDLKDLITGKSTTTWQNVSEELRICIEKEKYVWEQLGQKMEETQIMLKLILTGKKEDLIVPIVHNRICLYTGMPYDKKIAEDKIMPVSIDTLQEMGWLPKDVTTIKGRPKDKDKAKGETLAIKNTKVLHFWERNNVGICKYSLSGYSNLALKIMFDWGNKHKHGATSMFSNAGTFLNNVYPVPNDQTIQNLYRFASGKLETETPGRYFCNIKESEYKQLRTNYLHLSFNQQAFAMADNGLVNGPSFKYRKSNLTDPERDNLKENHLITDKDNYTEDSIITRRIYFGKKRDPKGMEETAGGKAFNAQPKHIEYLLEHK